MTTHTATSARIATAGFRFNPIAWLLKIDAAYRQMQAFKSLDADRRRDMDLTRSDQDQAFLRQFLQNAML